MASITPAFESLLTPGHLRLLERESSVVYGTDRDLRIQYVNPAWFEFARKNGGDASVLEWTRLQERVLTDAIRGQLAAFYRRHLRAVLTSGRPWSHDYECSSAERFRRFHLHVARVGAKADGLLAMNALLVEVGHDVEERVARDFVRESYVFEDDLVHQCSHCRRVRRRDRQEVWDWVPELVRRPWPATDYGLCTSCAGRFYPDLREA